MQRVRTGLWGAPLLIAAASLLLCATSFAESSAPNSDDIAAAAGAFAAGQKAQLSREFARAAELFELADELVPSPEAIRSAMRNHEAAGQPARAASLALAAKGRYPDDARTRAAADKVLARLAHQLARLSIGCDAPCTLLIDREALTTEPVGGADVFVRAGAHRVEAHFGTGQQTTRELELLQGEHVELKLSPPSTTSAPHGQTSAERSLP